MQVHRAGDEIRVLTRRLDDITSRVQEVVEAIRDLLLTAFFFDLLHLDGEDWIDRPGAERRAALEAIAPASLLILRVVTADPAEAKRFLAGTLTCGHRGRVTYLLDRAVEQVRELDAGRRRTQRPRRLPAAR